ncbi:MAG: hypothetical protein ACRERE_23695 [Candidatus Entotheonellia bacterium]
MHEMVAEWNRDGLIPYAPVMQSPRRRCETAMPWFHERLIPAPVGAVKPETRERIAREEGARHADC